VFRRIRRLIRWLDARAAMPDRNQKVTAIRYGVTLLISLRSRDIEHNRALLPHLVEDKRTELARSLAVERIVRQRLAGCDIEVTACVEKEWTTAASSPPGELQA
jgi:hypothetical protein